MKKLFTGKQKFSLYTEFSWGIFELGRLRFHTP